MTTFAEIQARVQAAVLDLPPATLAEIPRFVNDALRAAQRRHNFMAMEAADTFTTTAGDHALGALADFKAIRARPFIRHFTGSNRELEWAPSHSELVRMFALGDPLNFGRPEVMFVADATGAVEVYPFPDGASDWPDGEWRVTVPYWRFLPRLVGPTDTNWLLAHGEEYVLHGASARAYAFNFDEGRAAMRFNQAEAAFVELRQQDKSARSPRSGSLLPRADVHGGRFRGRGH